MREMILCLAIVISLLLPSVCAAEAETPSLKEIYADKFDFGTAVSARDVYSAERSALVLHQYNIVTPENELKPDSVLDVNASRKLAQEDDTAVAITLNSAKPILDFAQRNGLKVHGHVLVWHSQTPEAFFHEKYDTSAPYVSREVMIGRMENYIRLVLEETEKTYPGLIVSWDVCNEVIDDSKAALRQSNWTKVVGDDFVSLAFKFARQYAAENVKLYLNDYSTPYEPKQTGIVNLLKNLTAEGNIDGYGFQMHFSAGEPSSWKVETAIKRIGAMPLRLRVSEMDIGIPSDNEADLVRQASYWGELMKLLVRYGDRFDAVQVWGVNDTVSWRAKNFPLLFNRYNQPKPAFDAVVEAGK